ncbi:hypothetical protein M514_19802 [Trichuris suis]|uniref:Uncharacterized protein n=1 Tax=Trichuris suis TaxID=68888 RepID=A0A085NEM9_9BILA|nr:hypothetical protein M514_19802 [Trichuris suis]
MRSADFVGKPLRIDQGHVTKPLKIDLVADYTQLNTGTEHPSQFLNPLLDLKTKIRFTKNKCTYSF